MLRAAVGFDHISGRGVSDTWMAQSGYDLKKIYSNSSKGIIVNSEGYLTGTDGTATTNPLMVTINLTPWTAKANFNKYWIGFRLKCYAAGSSAGALFLSRSATTTDVALLTVAELATLSGGNFVGYNPHIDLDIDVANAKIDVYVDEVFFKSVPAGSSLGTSLKAGTLYLGMTVTTVNTAGLIGIRDIVMGDDIDGDGMTGMLGPRQLHALVLDEATGTNWTSTTGDSLLTTLKEPLDSTSGGFVQNSGPTGNLECSLSVPTLPTAETDISAIFLMGALQGNSNTVKTTLSIKNGTAQTEMKEKTLSLATVYNYDIGCFPTSPDGTKWTAGKINTTKIVVTPDA